MNRSAALWAALLPALLLFGGWVGRSALRPTAELDIVVPLAEFPVDVAGSVLSEERTLSEGELAVLAPDEYLLRRYVDEGRRPWDLYVAFYGRQVSGSSVHSPRNCLPGSGWEPVQHDRIGVDNVQGEASVNRYVVEHESGARALVYYWYQGRGRIEANEYRVKWDLVRDALLKRRTDEALVRIVFPLHRGEAVSAIEDRALIAQVADALRAHLPG
jgi:EpsI family protein